MVDSVLLPVQPKKIGILSDFIFAVSTMIFFFSSGESIEVSPVEPMISTALVPCCSWKRSRDWNAAKSTEPSLLNGVISATNEPVIFCLGIDAKSPQFYSSPTRAALARARVQAFGEGGVGVGRRRTNVDVRNLPHDPHPCPSPQGGGERFYMLT